MAKVFKANDDGTIDIKIIESNHKPTGRPVGRPKGTKTKANLDKAVVMLYANQKEAAQVFIDALHDPDATRKEKMEAAKFILMNGQKLRKDEQSILQEITDEEEALEEEAPELAVVRPFVQTYMFEEEDED